MFGKLLALPVRLLNVPARAAEKLAGYMTDTGDEKDDRVLSAPLESVAEAVEETVDGEPPRRR